MDIKLTTPSKPKHIVCCRPSTEIDQYCLPYLSSQEPADLTAILVAKRQGGDQEASFRVLFVFRLITNHHEFFVETGSFFLREMNPTVS